jgi:hypothetical protein
LFQEEEIVQTKEAIRQQIVATYGNGRLYVCTSNGKGVQGCHFLKTEHRINGKHVCPKPCGDNIQQCNHFMQRLYPKFLFKKGHPSQYVLFAKAEINKQIKANKKMAKTKVVELVAVQLTLCMTNVLSLYRRSWFRLPNYNLQLSSENECLQFSREFAIIVLCAIDQPFLQGFQERLYVVTNCSERWNCSHQINDVRCDRSQTITELYARTGITSTLLHLILIQLSSETSIWFAGCYRGS